MKKEHLKNLVLVALIITNFMLSQQIFANKKLWLFGYNFFANMGNSLSNDDYLTALHLAHPEKIFVNTGYQSSRFVYARGSDEYEDIFSSCEPVIHSGFSALSKEATQVSQEEWFSVLSGKSIYLSFDGEYTPSLYSLLIGINSTSLPVETFSHIAISENNNLYIMDNKSDTYYRIPTQGASVSTLIEEVMENNTDSESVINYSYELNFDKEFGDQKTVIYPMVPVYSSQLMSSSVIAENTLMRQDEIASGVVNRILSVFSFNPNTVRRYTEADGTLVFVENNGVLRISENGIVSFVANDTGIELDSSNHNLVSLARFIDSINSSAGVKADMTVISSDNDTNTYSFDYIIDGYPVKFENMPAVKATVSDGYLTEYTHILRNFTPMHSDTAVPMFIESLDKTISDYQESMNRIQIMKMYPAYSAGLADGEVFPDWHIEINNVVAE